MVDLVLLELHEVGQIDEGKDGGAHDGESCEESEVLQEVGLDEDESHEGTDGGEAAQKDGFGLVTQHHLGVCHIFIMCEDMEHVAHRHTEHHGAYAEGEQRELSLDEVHHGESEEGAEGYGEYEQGDGVPVAHTDEEHHEDYDE